MGFGQAISTGFGKYFNFSDRACRSEFWYWSLFTLVVGFATSLIDSQLNTQFISLVFNLATFIPSLAISVRRLHDNDASGWWLLLGLIPIIGTIGLLIWFPARGTDGPNRFGPDPLDEEADHEFGAAA